jgi:sugar-specific transcriptional regulator TrmB
MKTLENIGLTKTESRIYTFLVKEGEISVGKIIKETKMHPQIVYRALDGLKAKHLVFESTQNSKKYFRAEDPEKLLTLEEEKITDLKAVVSKLKSMEAISKDALVKILRGNEEVVNLRKRAYKELKKGETYYIIGASGDRFYQVVGEEYKKLEEKRIKKGVKKKMIAYLSQKKDLLKNDEFLDLVELRFLKEDLKVPTSTNIFGNTVVILIWDFNPVVILIESKSVAESYSQYFEILWKEAKG